MKVGDRIRFLNDVGGGIVRGFKGKDIALVEDQDGFEIPMLIKECVVIDSDLDVKVTNDIPLVVVSEPVRDVEPVEVVETKEGEQLTVCLAYLANDLKGLSTSDYECYLVNDSNYYLAYCYMTHNGNDWITRSVGTIEPNIKLFLEEFEKEDLNDMEQVCIQFFVFKKDKPFAKKSVIDMELRIDPIKFYKLHSFKENEYFDEPAIIYPLVEKDRPTREVVISPQEIKEAMYDKEQVRPRKQPIKKEEPEILKVDLHMHELIDNTAGMTSKEMFDYQMNKFRETMEEYKNKRGQKIVFVHGKGNGVLKNEINKELKARYSRIYFQDASFQEYGYGATMVTIK